jgi:hypothetical protein
LHRDEANCFVLLASRRGGVVGEHSATRGGQSFETAEFVLWRADITDRYENYDPSFVRLRHRGEGGRE